MDLYLSENPSKTEEEAVNSTGIEAGKEFSNRLENLIVKAVE